MSILLGIDTGGTYTDAVLLDDERGVISSAKALTTKYDLSVGIQSAVQMILPHPLPDIQLVSLSSTLATNAIVEGKGSPICLILIGYDPQIVADIGLERLAARMKRGGLPQEEYPQAALVCHPPAGPRGLSPADPLRRRSRLETSAGDLSRRDAGTASPRATSSCWWR